MKNNKLEIINGDGSNIEMSPVHTHIASMKPKTNTKKDKIIIPKKKKSE